MHDLLSTPSIPEYPRATRLNSLPRSRGRSEQPLCNLSTGSWTVIYSGVLNKRPPNSVLCLIGWLEPLLLPIYLNNKAMTFSRVDTIDRDDFRYAAGELDRAFLVPNFDFYLNMVFSELTTEYESKRVRRTDPVL